MRRSFQTLWLLAFAAPILAFAYIGHFSRYIADDFCTTSIALSKGIVGSVVHWYTTWAGQYTNWTIKGIVAYQGTAFPGVLPALILALWVGAAAWTLRQILMTLGLSMSRSLMWCLSLMVVFAIFAGIPSIVQSLYWLGASIPYTVPLMALVFYIGFLLWGVRQKAPPFFMMLGGLIITLIAGGTSEVFASFQIAVTGLLLIAAFAIAPTSLRRVAVSISAAGLIGAAAALVLIVIAPGTAVRQATFTEHLTLVEVGIQTLLASASYIFLAIGVFSPIPLLICIAFPAVAISSLVPQNSPLRLRPKRARVLLGISSGIAFILLMACFAPSIYAVASTPPARVYIFPQVVMVGLASFWGGVMGLSIRQQQLRSNRLINGFLFVLLLLGPVFTTVQTLGKTAEFRIYASEWDARDEFIRAAAADGTTQVEVKALTVDIGARAALETIGSDATNWVNQCAADYYGVKSLVAASALQMGQKSE